jgi:hypothetical protein
MELNPIIFLIFSLQFLYLFFLSASGVFAAVGAYEAHMAIKLKKKNPASLSTQQFIDCNYKDWGIIKKFVF